MPTIRLFCENGQHYWERESKRGRRPTSCPEHSAPTAEAITAPVNHQPRFTDDDVFRLLGVFEVIDMLQPGDLSKIRAIVSELWGNPEQFAAGRFEPQDDERALRKHLDQILRRYDTQLANRKAQRAAYISALPVTPGVGGVEAFQERYEDALNDAD